MAPHLQEHDVVQFVVPFAARLPQIRQLGAVLFIGEEAAAAGGLGVVVQSIAFGQRHLRLARAAAQIEQFLPVHPAPLLGDGGGQEFGAQGAQQQAARSGFPRHHGHGVAPLGHGPLAHHLAGDDEIEAVCLHPFPGLAHHEALAVQAGIEVGPVAVLGIDHHLLVFLDDLDDVQLDAQLLRHPQGVVALGARTVLAPDGMGMAFDAKAGVEIDSFHVNALIQDQAGGQHGIEAAGDQGHRFAWCGHGVESLGSPGTYRLGKARMLTKMRAVENQVAIMVR